MLFQNLGSIPDHLLTGTLNEILTIDWDSVTDPSRQRGVFNTRKAIHLRMHKIDPSNIPKNLTECSSIVECIDCDILECFKKTRMMCEWVLKTVCGIGFGRIMIVNLFPGGKVNLHLDVGKYFDSYARYHVPITTNKDVLFFDNTDLFSHMHVSGLFRLNNKNYHGLQNNSSQSRIHVICDINTGFPNEPF